MNLGSLSQPPEAPTSATASPWNDVNETGAQLLELHTGAAVVYVCPSRWQRIRLDGAGLGDGPMLRHRSVRPRGVRDRSPRDRDPDVRSGPANLDDDPQIQARTMFASISEHVSSAKRPVAFRHQRLAETPSDA